MNITTKRQYLASIEEGVRIEYDPHMINTIYVWLKDIGAHNEIPADKEKKRDYVLRVHEYLTVLNDRYPMDLSFYDCYAKFFKATISGDASRKGNNIAALVQCLNEWLPKAFQKKGKELTPLINRAEDDRLIQGVSVEKFPDHIILSQFRQIETIFGDLNNLFPNAKGYMHKIKEEAISRGLV
jgi:hypothetical protein